jgi:hypothetical protein
MDFDREWTVFAVEAEVHEFGVGRLVSAHNKLHARIKEMQEAHKEDVMSSAIEARWMDRNDDDGVPYGTY